MTRGRRAVLAGLVAALAAASFWLAPRLAAPPVALAEVVRGDLSLAVPATGTLEAVDEVALGPPVIPNRWDFKVTFMAPEGKVVAAGEPVLGFDASDVERELAERRNEAESLGQEQLKRSADLELEGLRRELARAEATAKERKAALKVDVPDDLVAARELEKARGEAELAEREVDLRRSQLQLLERRRAAELAGLARRRERAVSLVAELEAAQAAMTVRAPRPGTVVYQANWRGDKKKVGESSWRAEKVITLPDLTRLRAVAEVDEADAGRLAPGQELRFRLDAHPDLELAGTLVRVGRTVQRASPSSPLKVARAEIELARVDPERMRPGMRFRGDVEVERVTGALLLPPAAVVDTPAGPRVFRRRLLGFAEVTPQLGRRGTQGIEVLSGLAEGDRVALGDPRRREGAP